MKKEKAITLIALVITIIILLILAGISIAMLTGNNGLLSKAMKAKEEHTISQYREEINLIIAEEVAERKTEVKEEPMIVSLEGKIREKDWVNQEKVKQYNEEGITESDPAKNKYLIVESKEGYEFVIEVDNEKETAKIKEANKTPGEKYTITYHPNEGTGEARTVEVRSGFSKILENNTFTRTYYLFGGWCEKPEPDGTETIYLEGSKYKPTRNVTLYAVWTYNVGTIKFDANEGTGKMEDKKVTKGEKAVLPVNTFTKEDYDFVKWNTKADGTGTDYANSGDITLTEDVVTLYAIWKKKPVLAKNVLKTNATATEEKEKSPYVKYKNLDCRVLYNDKSHGLQIVSADGVEEVTLGMDDTEVEATDFTYSGTGKIKNDSLKKAAASYNNAVNNLNKRAQKHMDTKGIATDARCLGSVATLNDSGSFKGDTTTEMFSLSGWENTFKTSDTNYKEDLNQMVSLGLTGRSRIAWLASREVTSNWQASYFGIRQVDGYNRNSVGASVVRVAGSELNDGSSKTLWLIPVFLLSSDTVIKGGDGSSDFPYIVEREEP